MPGHSPCDLVRKLASRLRSRGNLPPVGSEITDQQIDTSQSAFEALSVVAVYLIDD